MRMKGFLASDVRNEGQQAKGVLLWETGYGYGSLEWEEA